MTLSEKNKTLVEENTVLKDTVEKLQTNDQLRRKDFARAFHWTKPQGTYFNGESVPTLQSWESIFVELGKLLACRDFRDIEGNVSEIECKLQDLETKIRKEIHPNL